MSDPDVYVVLKDGTSYGTRDGTPLCVDLDEHTAHMTKIGRCVKYVPAERVAKTQDMLKAALDVIDGFRPLAHAVRDIVADGWPKLASNAHLPASLEARLTALAKAYEGVADMVADADAEARTLVST